MGRARSTIGVWLLLSLAGCTPTTVTELISPSPTAASNRRDVDQFVGQYEGTGGRTWHITYGAEVDLSVFNGTGFGGFLLDRRRGDQFSATIDGTQHDVVAHRDPFGRVTGFRFESPEGELRMERAATQPRSQREIAYVSNGVVLTGTVYSPAAHSDARAAIVLVHGSGFSDRDSPYFQKLAFMLVDHGFVVLLPDKRGSGRSGGDWLQADLHQLADDALAGMESLKRYPGVDPLRIGLVGMSQGGWVVPIAAARNPEVAFVVNLSGSTVRPEELIIHEITNTFRQRGMSEPHVQQMAALQRLANEYLRTGEAPEAEAYVQEYDRLLATDLGPTVQEFPRDTDSPGIQWFRRIYGFDPIAQWRQVEVPALVVYGREDELDNVPVAESVARLSAVGANQPEGNLTVVVVEGTGHSLGDEAGADFHPRFKSLLGEWFRLNVPTGS
jgi:pimeloyl-ACP methyl ester carboxylesterase